jgi:cytochrome c553
LQPLYVARQLFDMRYGSSAGKAAALMKAVVNLSEDDIIAISAHVASLLCSEHDAHVNGECRSHGSHAVLSFSQEPGVQPVA